MVADFLSRVVSFTYSQFHKTLPRSSLQMHWISERFYEMGDINIVLRKNSLTSLSKIIETKHELFNTLSKHFVVNKT